jgi:hypothetical protein
MNPYYLRLNESRDGLDYFRCFDCPRSDHHAYTFKEFAEKIENENIARCLIDEARGNILMFAMFYSVTVDVLDSLKSVGCRLEIEAFLFSINPFVPYSEVSETYLRWVYDNAEYPRYGGRLHDECEFRLVRSPSDVFDLLAGRCLVGRHGIHSKILSKLYRYHTGSELVRRLELLINSIPNLTRNSGTSLNDEMTFLSANDFIAVSRTFLKYQHYGFRGSESEITNALARFSGCFEIPISRDAVDICTELLLTTPWDNKEACYSLAFQKVKCCRGYRCLIASIGTVFNLGLTPAIQKALSFKKNYCLLYESFVRDPFVNVLQFIPLDKAREQHEVWWKFVKELYLVCRNNGVPYEVARNILDFILPS